MVDIYIYICVCACLYIYTCVEIYIYIYVCVLVFLYIYIYRHICLFTYIDIYLYGLLTNIHITGGAPPCRWFSLLETSMYCGFIAKDVDSVKTAHEKIPTMPGGPCQHDAATEKRWWHLPLWGVTTCQVHAFCLWTFFKIFCDPRYLSFESDH